MTIPSRLDDRLAAFAVARTALTVIIATAADVGGLPALPFLSAGFFLANGDLLWRAIRSGDSREEPPASSDDDPAQSSPRSLRSKTARETTR